MSLIKKILKKLYFFVFITLNKIIFFFTTSFYYCLGYVTLFGFYGIGDTCYELAFLEEYKKKCKKKIRVVTAKKRKEYFKFYNAVDKVSLISDGFEHFLLKEWKGKKYRIKKRKGLFFVGHYEMDWECQSVFDKISLIYSLPLNSKRTFPKCYKDEQIVIKPHSVLVNCNSNSFSSKSAIQLIQQLAKKLKDDSYNVYINSNSDNVFNPFAERMFLTLNELLYSANQFTCIISIRTGLLDFIVNTNSKILCLYDRSEWGIDLKEKRGFSLAHWHGSSMIIEEYVEDIINNKKKLQDVYEFIKK